MTDSRALPPVSAGALMADACIHALGVTASLLACVALVAVTPWSADWIAMGAVGLYAVGLVAMLGCSAAYNLAAEGRGKRILRRLDHAAIFLMIAGTYSPVALLGIGGGWGWSVAGFVWAGALLGVGLKLFFDPDRFERAAIAAYLLLGWAGIVAIVPMVAAMQATDLALVGVGGLLYSLGVVAHVSRVPYQNAIWHGFVLAAAACHFVVVLRLAAGLG